MLCPYNRKRLTFVKNTAYEYNEEAPSVKTVKETYLEEYVLMNCTEEQCGAWRDGCCCYNGK